RRDMLAKCNSGTGCCKRSRRLDSRRAASVPNTGRDHRHKRPARYAELEQAARRKKSAGGSARKAKPPAVRVPVPGRRGGERKSLPGPPTSLLTLLKPRRPVPTLSNVGTGRGARDEFDTDSSKRKIIAGIR